MRLRQRKRETVLPNSNSADGNATRDLAADSGRAGLLAATDPARLTQLLWVGLAGLLAVRLAALWLNRTDLFFDEAQYWHWSLTPAFGYYSKPPLIAWLIGASTSFCGMAEWCIRLPAPLLHTATAGVIYLLGRHLYDTRTGVVSGLVYATLPAVSLSSGIISTDVPLLLCWAAALLGFARLLAAGGWGPAVLLGVAFGVGLNAKYAMAWFLPCAGLYLAVTPSHRAVLRDPRLWAALGIGVLLIVPNLAWNLSNSFATFAHTADNAKWGGAMINPLKALEFFGAQFGVFGPVLFGSLMVVAARSWRLQLPESDRLLLAFALPVLVAITVQALVSRAHANWAAVSYVAASVLVSAVLLRELSDGWLRASFWIHLAILVLVVAGTALAGRMVLPGIGDPFARTLGWKALAEATAGEIARARKNGRPYGAVISDDRPVTAELLYYMRAEPTPVMAWREKGKPQDHFEMTRPFDAKAPQPVLLVSVRSDLTGTVLERSFERIQRIATRDLPAGATGTRRITFYLLSGYRGR